jgi:hypothetical protein
MERTKFNEARGAQQAAVPPGRYDPCRFGIWLTLAVQVWRVRRVCRGAATGLSS